MLFVMFVHDNWLRASSIPHSKISGDCQTSSICHVSVAVPTDKMASPTAQERLEIFLLGELLMSASAISLRQSLQPNLRNRPAER